MEQETADVLYWVSNPSILSNDSLDDVEKIYEDTAGRTIARILHEVQHSNFQKDGFGKLVEASEQNPEVQSILIKLEGVKGEYVEVTNELVTTYLESLGKKRLAESSGEREQTPLVVEVDEGKHGKVLEAVIKEDIEGWRDKGKGPGPYTDLRQGWEKSWEDFQRVIRPKREIEM